MERRNVLLRILSLGVAVSDFWLLWGWDRAERDTISNPARPPVRLCRRPKSDKSPYNLALKLLPFYVCFALAFFIIISRMICAGAVEHGSKYQVSGSMPYS